MYASMQSPFSIATVILSCALLITIGASCGQSQDPPVVSEQTEQEQRNENRPIEQTYTLAQVAAHNSAEDCWMIIHDNVYNVTDFIASHPGGSAILAGCGINATNLFENRPSGSGTPHSSNAREILQQYYIGKLQ